MALEFAADRGVVDSYPFPLGDGDPAILDWAPLLEAIITDQRAGVETGVIAARFHNALVDAIVTVAERTGLAHVALSGGVFQNDLLVTRAAAALRNAGFEVLLHRRVPANDGGIALGQIAIAVATTGP
jgi:hydrogenase maturation protein HypF